MQVQSKRTLKLLCYHRLFFVITFLIVLVTFGYHKLLTYHAYRIFSQRMYMHGYRKVHGHLLKNPGTFGFESVYREPDGISKNNRIYLLILISSSPYDDKHAALRQAIRSTWGKCDSLIEQINHSFPSVDNVDKISCKLFFYMGRTRSTARNKLNIAEFERHNDLIIGDFIDSYHNMTRKILFGLKWASEHFDAEYILKADDDVFMNIPYLIHLLQFKYKNVENLYGGHVYYASVIRDSNHRHYVSAEELPDDWYPPFNKGGEMILSGHLIEKLVSLSTQVIRFQIDDAYIGILMNQLGVVPISIAEFMLSQWVPYFVDLMSTCDLKSLAGIGDGLTPTQLQYLQGTVTSDSTWYCVQYDSLLYYALFMFLLVLFVLLFMRQRYCPWLTVDILTRSIRIFFKKIRKS